MKQSFKLLCACLCLLCLSNVDAQTSVMRAEISAGSYGNVKTDSSGNLYVIGTIVNTPTTGTLVNRSGSIAVDATAQSLAPANASRKYLLVQNNSDANMWINFTTTAVQAQPSILLLPNASFVMETNFISTEAISIIGPTAGKTYTAKEF